MSNNIGKVIVGATGSQTQVKVGHSSQTSIASPLFQQDNAISGTSGYSGTSGISGYSG
jgi:hypothetical protein